MYLAEKLRGDHGVELTDEVETKIRQVERGLTDRTNISASANVESPSNIIITLSANGAGRSDLEQFIEDNRKYLETLEIFRVKETTVAQGMGGPYGKLFLAYRGHVSQG